MHTYLEEKFDFYLNHDRLNQSKGLELQPHRYVHDQRNSLGSHLVQGVHRFGPHSRESGEPQR